MSLITSIDRLPNGLSKQLIICFRRWSLEKHCCNDAGYFIDNEKGPS